MFFFFFQQRLILGFFFFFSSRRRHTRWTGDWSSDVCSSDLVPSHPGPAHGEGWGAAATGALQQVRPGRIETADRPRRRGQGLPPLRRRRHDRAAEPAPLLVAADPLLP